VANHVEGYYEDWAEQQTKENFGCSIVRDVDTVGDLPKGHIPECTTCKVLSERRWYIAAGGWWRPFFMEHGSDG
jgi:hypothetical protein